MRWRHDLMPIDPSPSAAKKGIDAEDRFPIHRRFHASCSGNLLTGSAVRAHPEACRLRRIGAARVVGKVVAP